MSKSYRRFEILLPRKFNDVQPVPEELIGTTLMERRREFAAVFLVQQIDIWITTYPIELI